MPQKATWKPAVNTTDRLFLPSAGRARYRFMSSFLTCVYKEKVALTKHTRSSSFMRIVIAAVAFSVFSANIHPDVQSGGASVTKIETKPTSIDSKLHNGIEYRDPRGSSSCRMRLTGLESGLSCTAQECVGVNAESGSRGW